MLGPLQVPRQQQAQGQQQQIQQQPQPQQQQQLQQPGDLLPPPQSGQDFTLSSVLHFLQTEWRRYERDRNEWEIERAEMRVRSSDHCHLSTYAGLTLSRKFLCRPGSRFWRENDGLSKMSNSTSCAVSKCWSMRFVLSGTSIIPFPCLPFLLTCHYCQSSKQLTQSSSQGVQTTKSNVSHGQKEEKEGSGGSSPRSEGASRIRWH